MLRTLHEFPRHRDQVRCVTRLRHVSNYPVLPSVNVSVAAGQGRANTDDCVIKLLVSKLSAASIRAKRVKIVETAADMHGRSTQATELHEAQMPISTDLRFAAPRHDANPQTQFHAKSVKCLAETDALREHGHVRQTHADCACACKLRQRMRLRLRT